MLPIQSNMDLIKIWGNLLTSAPITVLPTTYFLPVISVQPTLSEQPSAVIASSDLIGSSVNAIFTANFPDLGQHSIFASTVSDCTDVSSDNTTTATEHFVEDDDCDEVDEEVENDDVYDACEEIEEFEIENEISNNGSVIDDGLDSIGFDDQIAEDVEEDVVDDNSSVSNKTKSQRMRYSREEYKCITCPYTCTTERAFLRHLRLCSSPFKDEHNVTPPDDPEHKKDIRLSCCICGKDREGEQSLIAHMQKHKNDKHFCCDLCKFKTLQLKKLIQHRRMHTGEKPHLCPFCSYRSSRRDNLRSHVRRVHKKDNLPGDTFTPRSMLLTPSKNVKD